ncbi:MAG: hypothetical protein SNJ29_12280 [Rikenellaceae bacterium]
MQKCIIVEYLDIFNDEPSDISQYLQNISHETLIKCSLLFIARKNETVRTYLRSYFNKDNNNYINSIWDRWARNNIDNTDDYFITNTESSLRLYEYIIAHIDKSATTTISEQEVEINILKAYLLFNTSENATDAIAEESTRHLTNKDKTYGLLLARMFKYFDIVNYNENKELFVQTTKAIYLYKFLSENKDTQVVYSKYLEQYHCADWKDLMRHITTFAYIVFGKRDQRSYMQLDVAPSDNEFIKKCNIIDNLTVNPENCEDIDFRKTRSQPLYKITQGNYYVTYIYFLLEMIYKGVYFKLNDINSTLSDESKIKYFRAYYCDIFSEGVLLYGVLKDVYGNKYIQKSGNYIKSTYKIDAEPDYYIRNGNKIFLFESKDILIPSEAKTSGDYSQILSELQKRLHYEKKKGKITPKAILQLLNNAKKIISNTAEWDSNYKSHNVRIYPIIILHDNIYNCPGIQYLVSKWYSEELAQIKETYDTTRLCPITIINIDTFIVFKEQLKCNSLENLIEEYHRYTTTDFNLEGMTEDDILTEYSKRMISFEYYLMHKFKPDYNKLIKEIVMEYIDE